MKVLVCGSRNWSNRTYIFEKLQQYHADHVIDCIIEGGATGADRCANEWATANNIAINTFNADWKTHGKAAGPIRNRQMLTEGKPDIVIAFAVDLLTSPGTANMIATARKAGVNCIIWNG